MQQGRVLWQRQVMGSTLTKRRVRSSCLPDIHEKRPDMLPPIPFHFVRHGETDWNRQGRLQGWRDIPLNSTGESQAEALRPSLHGMGFNSIAVSPLARARRTAEILNRDLQLQTHFFDDLREMN